MMKKVFAVALCAILLITFNLSAWALGDNPPKPALDPAILMIKINPSGHNQGSLQVVNVHAETANVSDGTAVSAKLMKDDKEVSEVIPVASEIKGNTADLSLAIPSTVPVGTYYIQVGIASLNLYNTTTVYTINKGLTEAIRSVSANPAESTAGTTQNTKVTIETANMTDGTLATACLVNVNGTSVEGIKLASSTVQKGSVDLTLTVPDSIQDGEYRIKVTAGALSDSSTVYTIKKSIVGIPEVKTVSISQSTQYAHTPGQINVSFATELVPDGKSFTVMMVDAGGSAVPGVTPVTGTVFGNKGITEIAVPGSIDQGQYYFKVEIADLSLSKVSSVYNVTAMQPVILSIDTSGAALEEGAISGNVHVKLNGVYYKLGAYLVNKADNTEKDLLITQNNEVFTFMLPTDLAAGTYSIKVTSYYPPVTSTQTFTVKKPKTIPVLTTVETSAGAVLNQGSITGNIIINGSSFSSTLVNNKVNLYNSTTGNIVKQDLVPSAASASALTVPIPTDLQEGTYKVKAKVDGESGFSTNTFTILKGIPVITGINCSGATLVEGSIAGSIKIAGKYFSADNSKNKVAVINSMGVTVFGEIVPIAAASAELQFTVPASLIPGEYKLRVISEGNSSALSNSAFTVTRKPVIPSITTVEAKSGSVLKQGSITGSIVIYGSNFSTTASSNKVSIYNNATGSVVKQDLVPSAVSESSLTVSIPTDLAAGTYQVKVKVDGESGVSSNSFIILQPDSQSGGTQEPGGTGSGDTGTGDQQHTVTTPTPTPKPTITVAPTPTPSLDTTQTTMFDLDQIEKLLGNNDEVAEISLDKAEGVLQHSLKLTSQAVTRLVESGKTLKVEFEGNAIALPGSILENVKGDFTLNVQMLSDNEFDALTGEMKKESGETIEKAGESVDITITEGDKNLTDFGNNSLTVVLAVSEKADARKSGIYYWDEASSKWAYLGGSFDPATGEITCTVNHLTRFAVLERNKTFTDIHNSWAKDYIEVLASRYIIGGISQDAFDPQGRITRSQFAKLLVEALDIKTDKVKGLFTDCAQEAWYTPYVEAAKEAGIVGGIGNGKFAPDEHISREQMAVMVINALKTKVSVNMASDAENSTASFTDMNNISSWAKEAVLCAHAKGIITGNPDKSFNPSGNSLREQAAVVIYRLLIQLGELQ